ncbi:hypothetical protein PCASD_12360 [Puccinia coronata f. sp. avenae]|uniref:Uncharacterized protein n=1 Tax=Puccinia coronata f. sp. avenae TaxID=200324 RepID=A0A2N5U8A6_9BASI|nr:hypothetical protein PCASD_12360 [Puccinia coronata f. sp. avenae]
MVQPLNRCSTDSSVTVVATSVVLAAVAQTFDKDESNVTGMVLKIIDHPMTFPRRIAEALRGRGQNQNLLNHGED